MKRKQFLDVLDRIPACDEVINHFIQSKQSPQIWLKRVRTRALRELKDLEKVGEDHVFLDIPYVDGKRREAAGWWRYFLEQHSQIYISTPWELHDVLTNTPDVLKLMNKWR